MTLADLQHLGFASVLVGAGLGEVFTKRSNVNRWGVRGLLMLLGADVVVNSRWWNEISNRPSWLAVKGGVPAN